MEIKRLKANVKYQLLNLRIIQLLEFSYYLKTGYIRVIYIYIFFFFYFLFLCSSHRPLNVLRVTGSFSLGDSHAWIRQCLLDVPDQPMSDDVNTLFFRSTFIDTQLECMYRYIIYVSGNLVDTRIVCTSMLSLKSASSEGLVRLLSHSMTVQ